MRLKLENAGLSHIRCDSAGTLDAHEGSPPDSRMSAAGKRRGLPMTGTARGVRQTDFEEFDLILAMDRSNKEDLRRMAPSDEAFRKVRLFCEYCETHSESEAPDPYYGGSQGFELVLDLLEDGCNGILNAIQGAQP